MNLAMRQVDIGIGLCDYYSLPSGERRVVRRRFYKNSLLGQSMRSELEEELARRITKYLEEKKVSG
jgi:hypothetical protein